jgi:heme-degrading monooxygenase HmoA
LLIIFYQHPSIKGEIVMASMLVQHTVRDYSTWKTVYDSVKGLRTANGELSDQIFHDASNPNRLTILFKWNTLANAQKWAQSPELKAAMVKAGVDGAPVISFLSEV